MQVLTEVERKKGFKPIQVAELHADSMDKKSTHEAAQFERDVDALVSPKLAALRKKISGIP
jgi:hypothetical protein